MGKLKAIKRLICDKGYRMYALSFKGFYKNVDDAKYLRLVYKSKMKKELDLENPKTFNEKLQWLKIYDRNPEYTKMVDKYEAKKYVAERIGEEYIIETYGVWDSFDDIDFDALPNSFVLKCTHDSGGLVICRDKKNFDKKVARKKINRSLKNNYFYSGREWPYKNVKPRIIAEKYIADENGELPDYKFLCFNGESKIMFVVKEREKTGEKIKIDFFDMDFNHLNFRRVYPNASVCPQKPLNFEKMKSLAEVLSQGIPHLRVDFYEVNGKVYFGELTFFPGSGFECFDPEVWDFTLGEMLVLPAKEDKA